MPCLGRQLLWWPSQYRRHRLKQMTFSTFPPCRRLLSACEWSPARSAPGTSAPLVRRTLSPPSLSHCSLTSLQELRHLWQHKRSGKKLFFSCVHTAHCGWIRPFASSATVLAHTLVPAPILDVTSDLSIRVQAGCAEGVTIPSLLSMRFPATARPSW